MEYFSIQKDGNFVILGKNSIHKYTLSSLEVIVCDKPYLKLHVQNHTFLIKGSIKSIADFLPSSFIQVNRKVVVNVDFVQCILKKSNYYVLRTIHDKTFEISQRRYGQIVSAVKMHLKLNGSTGSGGDIGSGY